MVLTPFQANYEIYDSIFVIFCHSGTWCMFKGQLKAIETFRVLEAYKRISRVWDPFFNRKLSNSITHNLKTTGSTLILQEKSEFISFRNATGHLEGPGVLENDIHMLDYNIKWFILTILHVTHIYRPGSAENQSFMTQLFSTNTCSTNVFSPNTSSLITPYLLGWS